MIKVTSDYPIQDETITATAQRRHDGRAMPLLKNDVAEIQRCRNVRSADLQVSATQQQEQKTENEHGMLFSHVSPQGRRDGKNAKAIETRSSSTRMSHLALLQPDTD
jgi:hypothetical protein